MQRKKRSSVADSRPCSPWAARVSTAPDDDLPEITDEMLDRAERIGDKVIRRGRPPLGEAAKSSVTPRLDADPCAPSCSAPGCAAGEWIGVDTSV
jgi:hypothetical protein